MTTQISPDSWSTTKAPAVRSDTPDATYSQKANAFWLIALSLALIALFGLAQWGAPGFVGGDDGYYHLKLAALMRGDLTPQFVWLPFTILNEGEFVDHHWLFHVLQTPFAVGDLIAGGQIAAALFAAAALVMAGWLMRRQNVPGAALWSLAMFAASSAFVYRLSMPRAQSLSLLWLFAAIYLLLRRRERWLIVLGLTYVWLYDAFPLLLIAAGLYVVAARLIENQWRWGALIYPALGIALGLLINPYFPSNLIFIFHHLIAKLDPASVPVGNEWYPYTTAQLIQHSGFALLAVVGGVVALGWRRERMNTATTLTLGLCLIFGAMLMASRRFVEYFPAFAVLFCAFAWQPILAGRSFGKPARLGIAAAVIVAAAFSLQQARASIADDSPASQLSGAAGWLAANTPQGSVVFQTDWDDFPRLFFYNTHNVYIVGLDPTYLQRSDIVRYYLWLDLTEGRGLDLSEDIRQGFGAQYAISDLEHTAFLNRAAADPQFVEMYRDGESVVFRIDK